MPSLGELLEICDYFNISPSRVFDNSFENPALRQITIEELGKFNDDDYESLTPMQRWVEAMKRNEPIIVPDVKDSTKVSKEEQRVNNKLHAQSVMAVPFGPNPAGFLVLRYITRYMSRTSAMNTFAYVLHRAMAQRDSINKSKMALYPDDIKNENDIRINFFGDLEIQTMDGIWKESDINSPKSSKTVAYILLHRKSSHSALAIADALYPEESSDIDTLNKNIRGYVYRFRKSFEPISEQWLIEYGLYGYRVNPAFNVTTLTLIRLSCDTNFRHLTFI